MQRGQIVIIYSFFSVSLYNIYLWYKNCLYYGFTDYSNVLVK